MASIQTGTWKDLKDAKEQLGLGEPPPSGLVPIGDTGLYTTPDEPADPRDCDRYPSSPYCGGNPFSRTPVGLDVSTTLDIQPCGVSRSISLEPTLLFIKLPPVTAAYIPENCREEYEKKNRHEPPPPPPGQRDDYQPTPQYSPYGFAPDDIVCVVTVDQYFEENHDYFPESGWCVDVTTLGGSTNEIKYPSNKQVVPYNSAYSGNQLVNAKVSVDLTAYSSAFLNANWRRRYWREDGDYSTSDSFPVSIWVEEDRPTIQRLFGYSKGYNYQFNLHYTTLYPGVYQTAIWVGRFGDIFPRRQISPVRNEFREVKDPVYPYSRRVVHERFVVYCHRISGFGDSDRYPPPTRPPKKHCCEDTMGCCQPSSNNKQDQDLSEIKKMLREIKKAIGTDEYPVKMPVALNADYNDKGKKSEPGMTTEPNLTKLIGRFIRYFDGVMGEWGIGFKVADADPNKPGDQPKFVHAPDIASLMSEMYAHIFDMWIMQYQFLHLDQRHAIESMLARKVGIQNYYLLEALIDWTGLKRKELTKKIPFLFDIDAEGFEDFLKNKEQEIHIVDFDPTDKNAESFPDHLIKIKLAAAITQAMHTRKFGKNDDIPAKVKEILQGLSTGVKRVNSDELRTAASKEDFDQWLRDAENAFINRVGQGDLQNPYGVPYANRPKLTKIQDSLEGGESDGN